MKRLKYCGHCKNIWIFYNNHFNILRLDSGKKAKIISEKCYICKLKNGEFEYNSFLNYLTENLWRLEYDHKYLIKAVYIPNPKLFYMLPKPNNNDLNDFTRRINQMIDKLELVNPIKNIKDELILYLMKIK